MSDPWGPRPPEPRPPFGSPSPRGERPAGPYGPDPFGPGPYGLDPYGDPYRDPYGQDPYGRRGRPLPTPRRPWQVVLRGELGVVGVILAAGLVLGGIWALAAPGLADAADPGETRVSVDGLLALLQIGAGLVTAVGLVVLPGRDPVARLVAVLVGATVAGLLAALVGAGPAGLELQAPGAALLWPLVAALLTALRMLAGLLVSPEGDGNVGRRRRA